MRKNGFAVIVGQVLIAAVIAVTVGAFQGGRPGYFSDLTVTGTTTGVLPANIILFTTDGSCPTGWVEYTALRGRAPIGLVSGGTAAGTAGTAMTDLEVRVQQHTHTIAITDPGHTHLNSKTTWTNGQTAAGAAEAGLFATTSATASATTGITATSANPAASVAGPAIPYIQLLACKKS